MDSPEQDERAALAPTRPVAFVRRLARRPWLLVGIAAILEVPGRRSGTIRQVSLIPVELGGSLYLLSFGGVTDWARNLRAAGGGSLRGKGRTQAFTAIEVEGVERERVIGAYLAGSGPVKRDFNRRPQPADHPTFKVVPVA